MLYPFNYGAILLISQYFQIVVTQVGFEPTFSAPVTIRNLEGFLGYSAMFVSMERFELSRLFLPPAPLGASMSTIPSLST